MERTQVEHIFYFILAFLISFISRYWLYKRSKKPSKKGKNKNNSNNLAIEMKYLMSKFDLDKEKLNTLKIAKYISLLDGIIIALAATLVLIVTEDMVLIFTIGVVLIFLLIYVLYEILGRILIKKGYRKNGL